MFLTKGSKQHQGSDLMDSRKAMSRLLEIKPFGIVSVLDYKSQSLENLLLPL